MKTREFLDLLTEHSDKELHFEYQKNQGVPEGYHITEIKNISIDSVDCGGSPHFEKRTEVQLWRDENSSETGYMKAGKAKSIFDIVEKMKPMDQEAEIFFEYGNAGLPTSSYQIALTHAVEDQVKIYLNVPAVACKPRLVLVGENSGSCCGNETGCC